MGRREGEIDDKKVCPKEMVTLGELLISNAMQQEALVNLLVAKGIIKKAELLDGNKEAKA